MIDGIGAEIYMDKLIRQLSSTFARKSLTLNNDQLLKIAEEFNPKKVEYLARALRESYIGYLTEQSQEWILDRLFCTDFLIETELENEVQVAVAIDATADMDKVLDKKYNFESNKTMLQSIGVNYCLVVVVETISPVRDLQLMYRQASTILEVLEKMQAKKLWVESVTI